MLCRCWKVEVIDAAHSLLISRVRASIVMQLENVHRESILVYLQTFWRGGSIVYVPWCRLARDPFVLVSINRSRCRFAECPMNERSLEERPSQVSSHSNHFKKRKQTSPLRNFRYCMGLRTKLRTRCVGGCWRHYEDFGRMKMVVLNSED